MEKENEQGSFDVGQGEAKGGTADPTPEDIGNRLSQAESGETAEAKNVMEAKSAIPFDISRLSVDQLQALKSALAQTPDTIRGKKKANPRVTLRRMDGKLIVDYKEPAFKVIVHDGTQRRDVEKYMISVRFKDEDKFTDVDWQQFIEAPRISCEVISTRRQEEEIVEGETVSRATNEPVEMVKVMVHDWFTIKLPEEDGGGTMEIEARIANA